MNMSKSSNRFSPLASHNTIQHSDLTLQSAGTKSFGQACLEEFQGISNFPDTDVTACLLINSARVMFCQALPWQAICAFPE